jgi:predicted flap endonuclease-1-like 5' DNA nuclease
MLTSAQRRLNDFNALERRTIELEAENTQLRHDTAQCKQDNEALKRDLTEQEELKVQNKELARVLESMESSRKQYENDANRYRERAGKSEEQSDTLRIRLDEVEQNFIEMENQQHNALKDARRSAAAQAADDMKVQMGEHDDLQAINGIGKVFEQTLHELGIVSYRQIANFDVLDIARVNTALNEFKGRLEQDDWIGQAKELLLDKYGDS